MKPSPDTEVAWSVAFVWFKVQVNGNHRNFGFLHKLDVHMVRDIPIRSKKVRWALVLLPEGFSAVVSQLLDSISSFGRWKSPNSLVPDFSRFWGFSRGLFRSLVVFYLLHCVEVVSFGFHHFAQLLSSISEWFFEFLCNFKRNFKPSLVIFLWLPTKIDKNPSILQTSQKTHER